MPEGKDSYGSPTGKNPVLERQRREILRIRRSGSFRLGVVFTRAVARPWRLFWLPLSIVVLFWRIMMERLGRREYKVSGLRPMAYSPRKSIVFFPTNGVGLGHFTRLFAIAKRLQKIDADVEIIFVTTMPTLHLLENEGIPAYHLPGREKFNEMDANTWNMIAEEMMLSIFSVHSPKLFVFDGVFPYRGMLNSIKDNDVMGKIWLRRGMSRANAANMPVDSLNHFDLILHPTDSMDEEHVDEIDISVIHCDPIIYADEDMLMSREAVRTRLGIPEQAIVVYVQLGAGRINDIESDISITIAELGKYENVYIVLGESMIGERLNIKGERLRIIRDYPNSILFNGFYFAVIAGGYNSYHEVIKFSLPTLCYPNLKTGKDNQLSRVTVAEEEGCMIVLTRVTPAKVSEAITELLKDHVREEMRRNCKILHRPNGADQAAEFLLDRLNH